MRATLVLPCYNEAASLPQLIQRCSEVFDKTPIQVLLVDNGSSDNTPEILSKISHPSIQHLRVPINQGYGHGILCGLRAATTPLLAWSHADLQTDPQDVITAYEKIVAMDNPARGFVKGNRCGRPLADNLFTMGMSIFETAFMGARLWDINAQPVMFHSAFFQTWISPPKDFSLDLYAFHQARVQRLKVARFKVDFKARQHGTSHWNVDWKSKWRFIQRTLEYSWALKRSQKNKIFEV